MSPSVLLLGADYYGTLAAARVYGKRGIAVTMADEGKHARALYSRHVSEKLVHPPLSDPEALVDWLVAHGERHPGTFLYPPNDTLSWLFAAHRQRLSKAFVMYSPSEEAIITLLDKKRLHAACASLDIAIEVPATRELGKAGVADLIAGRLRYPVLLKPRTQIFLEGGIKGIIVPHEEALAAALASFCRLATFHRALTDRHPGIAEPMVQEYLPAAETNILSVSGFVAEDGAIVARSAMKILQRPRKVGIGLCFEAREPAPALVANLSALCKKVGYHGTFESEFIVLGERLLLIDFNPRFYNQMGFDIARGAELPMMVWHAARGERAKLEDALSRARAWKGRGGEVYCHKSMLEVMLTCQRVSGQMSKDDVLRWRHWYADHRATATDAVRDPDDRLPAVIDALSWVKHFVKHPRSFLQTFVLNR